jgi:hypothetical protein
MANHCSCGCATAPHGSNSTLWARRIRTVVFPLARDSRTIFVPWHTNCSRLVLKVWCLYAPPNASCEVVSSIWHFFSTTLRIHRLLFREACVFSANTASAAFVISLSWLEPPSSRLHPHIRLATLTSDIGVHVAENLSR